jgi:hypothetical protein
VRQQEARILVRRGPASVTRPSLALRFGERRAFLSRSLHCCPV